MNRIVIVGIAVASLAGCVTTGKYRTQVERADTAEKQGQDLQSQLDALKKATDDQKADLDATKAQIQADKAVADDLNAKLKADDDQIAALQKSNKELTEALEAKKAAHESKGGKHKK